MTKSITYKDAGVDITAGNDLVNNIKDLAGQTKRPEVISGIGGFAGLFSLENCQLTKPVLVAATDGIGTKLKLALDYNYVNTLGQDLVAMCVNDLICCGAEPLFFLDYFATSKLDSKQAALILNHMSLVLKDINCTLLGGETAEMPGLYQKNDFDMAGFAVGLVDRDHIIDGSHVNPGDAIIGLGSSGVHSNGYSLVRKIIEHANLDLNTILPSQEKTLGHLLLEPTKIYVNSVLALIKKIKVHAMAHITGGGLIENLPRVFPKNFKAVIHKNSFTVPQIFTYLQDKGQVPTQEMWRVFNMGVGFALIVRAKNKSDVLNRLKDLGETAFELGYIDNKPNDKTACVELLD